MSTNLMTVLIAVKWLQKEQSLVLDSCCTSVAALYKEGPVYDQPVNQVQPLPCPLNLTPRNFPVFNWTGQVSGVISWIKYSVGGGYHVHLECHVWDSIWCLPMRKRIKRAFIALKWSLSWPETVRWLFRVCQTSRTQDLPPEPEGRDWEWGWIAITWKDELKTLYKNNNSETWKLTDTYLHVRF